MIATASEDKTIKLWRRDGTLIASLNDLNKVSKISFSLDEETIVTASEDKTIKLWRRNGTLITSYNGDIKNIGFSRNSEAFVILSSDNTVRFLRRDGKLINTLKSDQQMSVNFSPDKEIVAITNRVQNDAQKTVDIWRLLKAMIK
ncbi:WD40 repeat domain-containing protein [uncultured Nostoc sp.]|uniref:WD40 repeat domain-containing protein n=1 Tax=uncultured Nostoc sp. TaxID=340711 RepID=UPI0035CAC4CF